MLIAEQDKENGNIAKVEEDWVDDNEKLRTIVTRSKAKLNAMKRSLSIRDTTEN